MTSFAAPGVNFFHLCVSDSPVPSDLLQAQNPNVTVAADPVASVPSKVVIEPSRKFTSASGCGSFSQVPVVDLCACADTLPSALTSFVLQGLRGVDEIV